MSIGKHRIVLSRKKRPGRRWSPGVNRRRWVHLVGGSAATLSLLVGMELSKGFADGQQLDARSASEVTGQESLDDLQKSATWKWPQGADYREQLSSYLDQLGASEEVRSELDEFWPTEADEDYGPALLDRLLDAAGLLEPRIAELNERLRSASSEPIYPEDLGWLTSDVPGWLQDTVRLACGRAFAQRRMYDEALESLRSLELGQVCDPATLLFFRAASEHHLLKKESCLQNLELLLERESELPSRYAQVARLMAADIQPLETDSLDEIARMMFDVERRLDLGRAGTRVRTEEENIVKKLDKLIDEIEQQMQKQQQQQQQQSGQGQSSGGQQQPMDDSQIAGGSGPGDVDQKDGGDRAGWGNLPRLSGRKPCSG
jgi:tetratricopeptide (TPR) repeat protein